MTEGHNISSFGLPVAQRPEALQPARLPREAHQAEILVGILQAELIDGAAYANFAATLVKVCVLKSIPPLLLSEATLDALHTRVAQLCHQWQALSEQETLCLEFNQ